MSQGEIQGREILAAAERLHRLQRRIDQATFEEKRLAVESLISEIRVELQLLHGKEAPIVIVKYRFNDPETIADYPSEVELMAFPREILFSSVRFTLTKGPITTVAGPLFESMHRMAPEWLPVSI